MLHRRFFVPVVVAMLVGLVAVAMAQVTTETYVPRLDPVSKQPDPGTTVTNPNGTTTTTYKDGWTKTTEPDKGFEPGGSRETWKDPQGRIREIFRKGKNGRTRHHYVISDDPDKKTTTVHTENYDANGELIDAGKEVTKDGRTIKYRWDAKSNGWIAAGMTDAMLLLADAIYDRAFAFATALSAIGIISMAFLQTVKDTLPVRRWFQLRWMRGWLETQSLKAAAGQVPEEESPPWKAAENDLVRLATGGNRDALFDLPIEQLCAQMNAAAGIVLDYPWLHRSLLYCLAAGVAPADLQALLAVAPSAAKPRSQQTDDDKRALADTVDARSRVGHQIQRNIDALQIDCGHAWKFRLQGLSIVVSGLLVVIALWFFGQRPSLGNLWMYVLGAVLSGFLAPVARDLVSALQQLRK